MPDTAPELYQIKNIGSATLEDLSLLVQSHPLIDNHAHNILKEEHANGSSDFPFESITSEAQGPALGDHVHTSLPHIRAMKQLAQLYGCPESARSIKAARQEWIRRDYQGLVRTCLEGTHGVMMDDGLDRKLVEPYRWHRQYMPRVSRIVRIEAIAADILEQLALKSGFLRPGTDADWSRHQSEAFFVRFNGEFRNQVRAFANDPDVRGFKSVICYRTGLDISLTSRKAFRPQLSMTGSDLLIAFHDYLQQAVRSSDYRIQRKPFNDYLVVAVCDVLEQRARSDGETLPFQFHTGLGDSDLRLLNANPAYMQPLIEEFSQVDFVLLHSSYPYTREAGYLVSTYANAWLDIGEVFPKISREGQETILKQTLELTPASKILWSTDACFFPETYWLANRQFRETLDKLLRTGVLSGDYTIRQAIDMAADIMFWNSNSLYKLGEESRYPHLLSAYGRQSPDLSARTMMNYSPETQSSNASLSSPTFRNTTTSLAAKAIDSRGGIAELSPTPTNTLASSATHADVQILDHFLAKHPFVKYIWLHMLDYTATQRQRMVPVIQFRQQLVSGRSIGITRGLMQLLQNDSLAPGGSATGEFLVQADMSTLSLNKGLDSPSAIVQTWWLEHDSETHIEGCPRWTLQRQVTQLRSTYNITVLMGCEIKVVFLRPQIDPSTNAYTDFTPLNTIHAWSTMTYQSLDFLPVIEEIVDGLAAIDILIPHFHAEAAPGQWEFPLPPAEPLTAIDMLYQARGVVTNVARKHGVKATFHPKPFAHAAGTGCHTHFSIAGPGETVARYSDRFLAGILEHLPSIMALTMPLEESYTRIQPGTWSGGEYVAWGTQNRETPIRACAPAHWELKPIDGTGNLYLGTAALLASAIDGLHRRLSLTHGDCCYDPSAISSMERTQLGVTKKLPQSLSESLNLLERDRVLHRALGDSFVANYLAVKREETEMLAAMSEEKRRLWLIARY